MIVLLVLTSILTRRFVILPITALVRSLVLQLAGLLTRLTQPVSRITSVYYLLIHSFSITILVQRRLFSVPSLVFARQAIHVHLSSSSLEIP